ncbi:MAG: tripartite tricarboxylate transporter substrate binding protein [Proteobacteria bacterium]|nr:tripartite tricarboxylate transporter substrate binding protein [Burkholderiales bacterium]
MIDHCFLRRSTLLGAVALLLAAAVSTPALAQSQKYPDRPLRLITGFLPGGVSDVIARVLGERLGERLNERVVIDGRPGAGGMVSMEIAAKANPDGHTIYLAQPVVSIAGAINKYSWDVVKAFAPIGLIGASMTLLAANPSFPASTPKEFLALARAKPGTIDYGSSGYGGPNHLAAELFQVMAKVKLNHVPYKGAGATLPALIGGEVPVAVLPLLAGLPQLKAGKIKAIGVSGTKRSGAAPDIPALGEVVPGFNYQSWFGFVAPAGTPRPIIVRLNAELNKILDSPEIREKLSSQGVDIETSTPEQLGQLMAEDVKRLARLIKETGIKLE